MILRAAASLVIVGLIALTWALPQTAIGRRGSDPNARLDVQPRLQVGEPLESLEFVDLDGRAFRTEDLLGHRVLLTFERSVDW